jgi:hypothetical protein
MTSIILIIILSLSVVVAIKPMRFQQVSDKSETYISMKNSYNCESTNSLGQISNFQNFNPNGTPLSSNSQNGQLNLTTKVIYTQLTMSSPEIPIINLWSEFAYWSMVMVPGNPQTTNLCTQDPAGRLRYCVTNIGFALGQTQFTNILVGIKPGVAGVLLSNGNGLYYPLVADGTFVTRLYIDMDGIIRVDYSINNPCSKVTGMQLDQICGSVAWGIPNYNVMYGSFLYAMSFSGNSIPTPTCSSFSGTGSVINQFINNNNATITWSRTFQVVTTITTESTVSMSQQAGISIKIGLETCFSAGLTGLAASSFDLSTEINTNYQKTWSDSSTTTDTTTSTDTLTLGATLSKNQQITIMKTINSVTCSTASNLATIMVSDLITNISVISNYPNTNILGSSQTAIVYTMI